MTALAGLSLTELEGLISPLPRFRAGQIYEWIIKGASSFDQMTNIPIDLRKSLSERFCLFSSTITNCYEDNAVKKLVLSLKDSVDIEVVLLNDVKNRFTACLSTQAGCPAGCLFCKTGSLGFKRNLDYYEIIEQYLHLTAIKQIDNIVIMGMGEPLLNLNNLRKAINIFTDPSGMNISRRRITVSTCGILDGLLDIAKNGPYIRLALSLVTADETLRQKLMPISKTNPLKKIREALLLFQNNGGSRITLEIPLLGGINTRENDARLIAGFAKGIGAVINIIPWNPVPGLEFEGKPLQEPSKTEKEEFIKMLENNKLKVTTRLHKGKRIMGACGQLGNL
ncbi:MAG: 23S rRNA (adenine(2503)-C(2))-methyltransferase RlmN [Treponema sp.]|nr:23S rRNA (adenine(2503)-C(2))-methyltransferase RlmN [Treponema sp.]